MSTKILYNSQNKDNARYLRKNMTRQEQKYGMIFLGTTNISGIGKEE